MPLFPYQVDSVIGNIVPEEMKIMLMNLNCGYMFIGHNVVDGIKFINNMLWYTDTGISRSFGTNTYQYIDINNMTVNIRTLNI